MVGGWFPAAVTSGELHPSCLATVFQCAYNFHYVSRLSYFPDDKPTSPISVQVDLIVEGIPRSTGVWWNEMSADDGIRKDQVRRWSSSTTQVRKTAPFAHLTWWNPHRSGQSKDRLKTQSVQFIISTGDRRLKLTKGHKQDRQLLHFIHCCYIHFIIATLILTV